jgi:alkylhydroperoxidase family enzyme
LARADIEPETLAALRDAFPRAARYLTDAPDAPPMPPLLAVLARHPSLAAGWLTFSGGLLDHGVLDARVRELLLLAVVQRTKTSYVWKEHVAIARSVGVTDDELQRLEAGSRDGWDERDAVLLRAVDELLDEQSIGDATWTGLTDHFDEQSLLELLFVVGTYTCLGMVLNGVGLVPTGGS